MEVIGEKPTNKMIGIYVISNKINNRVYVGSSKRLLDRFTDHKRDLRNGRHGNIHLLRAYQKYGESNFTYSILEKIISKDRSILLEKETFWIKKLNALHPDMGYNIRHYDKQNPSDIY